MTGSPPISTPLRLLLGVLAALAIVLLVFYWIDSPKLTTVTTIHNSNKQPVWTFRRVQDERSDAVVLGLAGLGVALGLTAISGGTLKLTAGSVGIEAVVATVGKAGQLIGELSASHAEDPDVQAARARWERELDDLKRRGP